MSRHLLTSAAALLMGCFATATPALAQDADALGFELTPPRLALADGEVSFWRTGAEEWAPARVNIALAEGDELYAGRGGSLEIQIGPSAYLRASEETHFGLLTLEPDYLQLRLTAGQLSLDLRRLKASHTLELATANAVLTFDQVGYYRVTADDQVTTATSRRGGRATVSLASGQVLTVAASEQVVVTGLQAPQAVSYAAPELDGWDRWNYARTDSLLDALSSRYVAADVYGAADLDQYGDWRVVETYGSVWVPRSVPVGWAPYSTGRWQFHPAYSWTWVDDAPWGWAPYHYGRWVYLAGVWAWAPGPLVARTYYAPALVAFFGQGGVSVEISVGSPLLGWVALGWGEPLIPWWGPARYRHALRWAGWGGPRFVNGVAIRGSRIPSVRDVRIYRNAGRGDALVTVERSRFGRGPVARARVRRQQATRFEPLHGQLSVAPGRSSRVAAEAAGRRPPSVLLQRQVLVRRPPRLPSSERAGAPRGRGPSAAPRVRVVPQAVQRQRAAAPARAPFARSSAVERSPGPPAPRLRDIERAARQRPPPQAVEPPTVVESAPARAERRVRAAVPPAQAPGVAVSRPRGTPRMGASGPRRELPGEPANRVYRDRRQAAGRARDGARRQGVNERPRPQRGRSRGDDDRPQR